ncbi:hypothetical protein BH10BAC4_BH10BAC4_06400 [soil metagenome]
MKNNFCLSTVIILVMLLVGIDISNAQTGYNPAGSNRKLKTFDANTPASIALGYQTGKTLIIKSDNHTKRRYIVYVAKKEKNGTYTSIAAAVVKREGDCQIISLPIQEPTEIYLIHRYQRVVLVLYRDDADIKNVEDAETNCEPKMRGLNMLRRPGISGTNGGSGTATTSVEDN